MAAYYLTRRSHDTWYVAREYKYKGQDACTITWNVKNAKRFESEAEADACNDRLLVSGWIQEPFDKTKAK